ncbi:MAG: HU family DNA-binding protein [Magnetococcales bacterium]|nr:HU family DNA-binding protein [Magnetococcales bacterium]
MTKSSLISAIAGKMELSRKEAEIAVNTVFETISGSLDRDDRVELRGFGSFGVKHRRSRDGRNPKTGDHVLVDAKRVLFFKAGKELRKRVDV